MHISTAIDPTLGNYTEAALRKTVQTNDTVVTKKTVYKNETMTVELCRGSNNQVWANISTLLVIILNAFSFSLWEHKMRKMVLKYLCAVLAIVNIPIMNMDFVTSASDHQMCELPHQKGDRIRGRLMKCLCVFDGNNQTSGSFLFWRNVVFLTSI